MRALKHILVVVDPTAQVQPCVKKAAVLARAHGAVLDLYICDYQSSLLFSHQLGDEVVQTALRERARQLDLQLRSLADPLRLAGMQVVTGRSFDRDLHIGVIGRARACGADLVVKDTHNHGPVRRALFAIADWNLIRECPSPLLLAKPAAWHPRIRVAAALDPGHAGDKPASLDHKILEATDRLAQALGGEALAVHATRLELHATGFEALLAGYPAFAGRGTLVEGPPAAALPDYAARMEVDVLVAGAVSRSALHRLVVGSTAERLLDRLPCDILVLKPDRVDGKQQDGGR